MSKWEKHPAYKESGVEWIGKIPEHWKVIPGLKVFSESKRKNIGMIDNRVLSLSYGKIIRKPKEKLVGLVPESFETYQIVKAGDIIIRCTDLQNDKTSLRTALAKDDGIITSAYLNLNVKDGSSEYLHYLLHVLDITKAIYKLGSGLRQNLGFEDFKRLNIIFPPKQEQTKIASYLDKKTSQINKAINQKEKLIELLKERRQIIINEAVTKGVDENGELRVDNGDFKDSGIEWIGRIPKHWEIEKLFGLSTFIRGNSSFGKDELLKNGKYVALQYGKTYKVDIIDETYQFYVNDEFYKKSQVVNYGDIIFVSTSETIEDLGHSAYYNRKDLGLLGGEQILLNPKKDTTNSKYLYFSSKVFSKELKKFATGIKVFRFNINNLKTIYIPLPPKKEQEKIVKYIDNQTTKIDKAIQLQQNYIEKLKEYKATLVDSAVTGKVRVV